MQGKQFGTNLQLLCSFEHSVSQACRAMDINRQQFSKYLSGASKPSNRNIRKICDYFQVRLSDLFLPDEEFSQSPAVLARQTISIKKPTQFTLQSAFENQRGKLAKFLGVYHSFFYSFSWKGKILCALTILYEADGLILTKTLERVRDPDDNSLFLSKYSGQAAWLGDRIYIIEFQSLARDAIVESVLYPMSRSHSSLLQGATFGVSSRQRHPYMAKVVWKFLGPNADLRSSLKLVGLHEPKSHSINPQIRSLLGEPEVFSGRLEFGEG
ncbi:MAG: helix-turn-helix transcriptional regulator [Salaquimonas sp.]